jgi:plasmid stabilization system protein ParE
MVNRIEYIHSFYQDMTDVIIYLEDYPQKAKRIFGKLDNRLSALPEYPEMYPVYNDYPVFRRIVIEDYLVFYIYKEKDRLVEIHRLINGRMDVIAALG